MPPPNENREWLDGSLYPDREVPETLENLADRVDFVARVCGAWDFGILPETATVREISSSDWRQAVEECQLLTSPAYHLLREWHGLPGVEYLGRREPEIANDPSLEFV